MLSRRGLLGSTAAAGVGVLAGTAALPAPARAETPATPFTPVTTPHLVQAEQMVQYQRMLAAGQVTDGLVGHWALDGTGADRSGFDRPVTLGSGATWTNLRAGGELSFDGTPAAFAATAPVIDTTSPFTVSAWVRLSESANPANMYTAVSQDGATSRFLLQYDAGWVFKVRSEDQAVKVSAVATTTVVLGKWVHLTGVCTAGQIHIYVDGVLEGSANTAIAWAATEGFNIGRAKFDGVPVNRFKGAIDDVRAYNRALTAAEIAIVSGRTARQNNVYMDSTSIIWGQPSDPSTWIAHSRCNTFTMAVLKRSYPWATDDYFRTYFAGDTSPKAADYQQAFQNGTGGPHFTRIRKVADLKPGDLIAIDYRATDPTGHIVTVRQVKGVYTGSMNFTGETQHAVEIIDSTSQAHGVYGLATYEPYPDTRILDGSTEFTGVGIGHMMFYASSSTGEFSRYRWSANSGSEFTYPISARPISAARVR
jgi:Concanavalin A-like lectin/glucanases superfamily